MLKKQNDSPNQMESAASPAPHDASDHGKRQIVKASPGCPAFWLFSMTTPPLVGSVPECELAPRRLHGHRDRSGFERGEEVIAMGLG